MLINPNLLLSRNAIEIKKVDGNNYRNTTFETIDFSETLVDGKVYAFSFIFEQTDNGSGQITVGNLLTSRSLTNSQNYQVNKRIKFKFTWKNEYSGILIYTDRVGNTSNIGGVIKEAKLEEDETTPYIPHEKAIETAKRQYFIGGGTFKEIFPIS